MNRERWDVVVVGGGPAGLAAATWVATAGKRTLLVERATGLGGRAGTSSVDGFDFGQGLHALYRGGSAEAALAELGVALDAAPAPASGALMSKGQALHAMPVGFVTLLGTTLLSFTGKLAAARALHALDRAPLSVIPDAPLSEWVSELVPEAEVREVVLAILGVVTYTRNAELVSARVAVQQLRRASSAGVLYLHGGWGRMVDGLRAAAEARGVEVRTGAAATRVLHDEGRVEAVIVDGEAIDARAAILAIGPHAASAMVGELPIVPAGMVPARAACLDLGLRRLPMPERRFVVGVDERFFFNVQSRIARLAPESADVASVVVYLRPGEEARREELEAIVDRLQPGWRAEVVHARYLPKMTVFHDHPRPAPSAPPARAPRSTVFTAGDWVGRGEVLLDAALGSARRAAHDCVEILDERGAEPRRARVA